MPNPMIGEPVLTLALLQALVALAVAFGLDWSAEQVGAVTAVLAAILGVLARRRVTPVPPA